MIYLWIVFIYILMIIIYNICIFDIRKMILYNDEIKFDD